MTRITHFTNLFFYLQVDQTDPPFPRLTENWWYGCDALGTSAMRNNNNNNVNVNVGNSNSVADYMDDVSAESGNLFPTTTSRTSSIPSTTTTATNRHDRRFPASRGWWKVFDSWIG